MTVRPDLPHSPGAGRSSAARVTATLLWLTLLQVFIVETLVISGWHGRYSRSGQFISELGTAQCANASGCTDLSFLMNLSIGVASVSLAIGAILWARVGVLDPIVATGLTIGSVGLLGLALFHLDSHVVLHSIAANLFFALTPLSLTFAAAGLLRSRRAPIAGTVALVCGLIASSSWIVHASGLAESNLDNARGFVQRMLVYFTILCVAALATAYFSATRDQSRSNSGGPAQQPQERHDHYQGRHAFANEVRVPGPADPEPTHKDEGPAYRHHRGEQFGTYRQPQFPMEPGQS
jgi:hypothetical membrane protein